jgi:FkbM family methyltransferase
MEVFIKKIQYKVGLFFIPVVRLYIKYFPFDYGKLTILKTVRWKERNTIAKTVDNIELKLRTNDLIQGYIYYFGVWEPTLTNFIRDRLINNPERTFIDVGANIGYYSTLGGESLTNGKVVAIEAFPSIYNRLVENIRLNGYENIHALNLAASDKSCFIDMFHAGDGNEGATTSIKGKLVSTPISVKGLPLSEILSCSDIESTRLIKIDTEGAEYSVLKGLFPILKEMQNDVEIIVEISPEVLAEGQIEDIFESFSSQGFFAYELCNNYSLEYYLYNKSAVRHLLRLEGYPKRQTDIVFSKEVRKSLLISAIPS